MVIQKNGSAVYIIIAHQQLNHCRFSCSGRADNGNFLTRFYLRAEIMNDDLIRIVSELYMIKGYRSCYRPDISRIFCGLVLFLFVQEFEDTLGCAICWIGWVKFFTYWINAWMSPIVTTF